MTILYGSGISNSTRHSGENLPLLVVGGGAGRLNGGRHLDYTDKPSIANLLVTLMDKLDVPVEKIGGSTGKLPIDTLSGVWIRDAPRLTPALLALRALVFPCS